MVFGFCFYHNYSINIFSLKILYIMCEMEKAAFSFDKRLL